jgi:hypothetical protein
MILQNNQQDLPS